MFDFERDKETLLEYRARKTQPLLTERLLLCEIGLGALQEVDRLYTEMDRLWDAIEQGASEEMKRSIKRQLGLPEGEKK